MSSDGPKANEGAIGYFVNVIQYFIQVLRFTNDQLVYLHVLHNEQLLLPTKYQGQAQVLQIASKKRKREDRGEDQDEGLARKQPHGLAGEGTA